MIVTVGFHTCFSFKNIKNKNFEKKQLPVSWFKISKNIFYLIIDLAWDWRKVS